MLHRHSKAMRDETKKVYKKSTLTPTINHSSVSGSGQVSHQQQTQVITTGSNQKLNRQRSVTKGRTVLQAKKNDLTNVELLE